MGVSLKPSAAVPARTVQELGRDFRKSRRSMTYSFEPEYINAINDLVPISRGLYVTAVDVANDVVRAGLPIIYSQVQQLAPVFNFLNEQRQLYDNALARSRVLGAIEELRIQVTTLMGLRTASAIVEGQRLIEAQRAAFTSVPPACEAYFFWSREGVRLIDREIQPILTPGTRGALSLLPRHAINED